MGNVKERMPVRSDSATEHNITVYLNGRVGTLRTDKTMSSRPKSGTFFGIEIDGDGKLVFANVRDVKFTNDDKNSTRSPADSYSDSGKTATVKFRVIGKLGKRRSRGLGEILLPHA